jgi:alpha-1,2-mannosyltransferase
MARRQAVERLAVATVAMGVIAPAVAIAARAVGASVWIAAAMAAGPFFMVRTLSRRLPQTLDGFARGHRTLGALWCVIALAAVGQTMRLAVFIDAPSRTEFSILPADTFWREHSCFSAYIQAADRDRDGDPNVYELPDATYARYRAAYAPLDVDDYLYPPTFLPLPRLGLAVSDDFFTLRRGWFAIEIAVWLLGLAFVARFIGGREGLRVALWSPAIWVAFPVLLTLQIGNFQLMAFALGMLAFVAIESGQAAVGGITLAVLGLGKVFPAILVLVLIARRQWRAVMWTGIGSIIVSTVAVWVVTPATFRVFLSYMLTRLSHGDQFFAGIDSTNRLRLASVNFSVFGFVMKLREFGISAPPGVADALTWAFTVLLAVLVWLAASNGPRRLRLTQVCLAALVLAATRSPFVPSAYGTLGALWLIALLAAEDDSWRRWSLSVAGLIVLAYVVPDRDPGFPSPRVRLGIGFVQQLAVFGLAGYVLVRAWRSRFTYST